MRAAVRDAHLRMLSSLPVRTHHRPENAGDRYFDEYGRTRGNLWAWRRREVRRMRDAGETIEAMAAALKITETAIRKHLARIKEEEGQQQ